ncbi:capsule biosynthesis GfcC family protein [Alteromonas sp. C1M14]|uniref:capsule biosynthesis GfcC family protein n=1 Tax=Alteromonas sp. C1M14 TaxID=2841567 RepID=UPI001C08B559|nr:capsule biosynthesis GfcC family protein [Alteromonas sp. C1M14]MBU2979836.1 capsule biosynthesis GfcC family protein [Alteromonas sp. C1M14]
MIKRALIFCCLLATMSSVQASVNVTVNGQQYRYINPVRLSLVLHTVGKNGQWYWPACAIYSTQTEAVEAQRQAILQDIDALAYALKPTDEKAMALSALGRQIASWKLAKRLPVDIHFDAARLDASKNPMLQPGNYILSLRGRPQEVWVSGLVNTPGAYEYQNTMAPFEYAKGIERRADADPDYVYVISPRGEVSKQNIAYWGKSFSQVMPGSQIYVPLFSWLLSPDVDELNRKIAELAVHRVLP